MAREDTQQRILDASEWLCAHGSYLPSSRSIATLAGVNTATINYYFGTKKNLIKLVFERRLTLLNAACRRELGAAYRHKMQGNRTYSVHRIIKAFLKPFFDRIDVNQAHNEHLVLVGRAMLGLEATVQEEFFSIMETSFELLSRMLCQTVPNIPKEVIYHRICLSIGTVGYALCRIGRDCSHMDNSCFSDSATLVDGLVSFLGAAVQAPILVNRSSQAETFE